MIAALHTMDETAGKLRISRRYLQDLIQAHPYYRTAGRKKLFADEDINRLIEAMSCRGNSSRRKKAVRANGTSGAPTSASDYNTALELASGRRPSAFSPLGESKPNVVSFDASQTPRRQRQHS